MTDNTTKFDYDLAVIGSGPAGYVSAIRASQLGMKTALIEKGKIGGVCTNVGCIPTKALIHAARLRLELEHASDIGLSADNMEFDFSKTAAHRDKVVAQLSKGVGALLKGNKVNVLNGNASFVDSHNLKIAGDDGEDTISAAKIFIASGSKSSPVPGIDFDGEKIISSSTAVSLNELPESILIVGGGYIGCEFAAAFCALGVKVVVVEMLDRLLPLMDKDCSQVVTKELKKMGVEIHTGKRLEKLEKSSDGTLAELSGSENISTEKTLISIGRRPCVDDLALDAAGVNLSKETGGIEVNEHMQTSQEHIYAIGDVTCGIMLAHCGSHEGIVAAEHASGKLTAAMDYRVVPACAFTVPEIGTVGITEEEVKEQNIEAEVKKYSLRFLGKAIVDGHSEGFVKMIADAHTGELLGVHIVSANAGSLIGEAALALKLEVTAAELADTIHAHPTMPECMMETAQGIIGQPINWMG